MQHVDWPGILTLSRMPLLAADPLSLSPLLILTPGQPEAALSTTPAPRLLWISFSYKNQSQVETEIGFIGLENAVGDCIPVSWDPHCHRVLGTKTLIVWLNCEVPFSMFLCNSNSSICVDPPLVYLLDCRILQSSPGGCHSYTVSHLRVKVFRFESTFIGPVCSYDQLTWSAIQYCTLIGL